MTAYVMQRESGTAVTVFSGILATVDPNTAFGDAGNVETYVAGVSNGFNRVVRAGGQILIKQTRDAIFRSTDDGRTWTNVYTYAGFTAENGSEFKSGIEIIYGVDGQPRFCCFVQSTISDVWALTSLDGITWTATDTGANSTSTGIAHVRVWRDSACVLYQDAGTSLFILLFRPQGAVSTLTDTAGGATAANQVYPIVWNGDIYWLSTGGTSLFLRRLFDGIATTVATLNTGGFSWAVNWGMQAWVDPSSGDLVVIARDSAPAWKAFSVTSGFVVTERTATMVTGSSLAGFGSASMCKGVLIDQQAAGTGNPPDIYIFVASNNVAGNVVYIYKYNGVSTLIGVSGAANDFGGAVEYAMVVLTIGGEHFFTRGAPYVFISAKGTPQVSGTRTKYKADGTRQMVLVTLVSPATYNLATTSLTPTPIKTGTAMLVGIVSGVEVFVKDDGAGAFPVSTILPGGGTINYATGALTGTTATLDGGTVLVMYFVAGTGTIRWYAYAIATEYPAALTRATLLAVSHGAITGGDTNTVAPAIGAEQEATVAVAGVVNGGRFAIEPEIVLV
jgi:hypothetical protein